jgi:hypothetical protein
MTRMTPFAILRKGDTIHAHSDDPGGAKPDLIVASISLGGKPLSLLQGTSAHAWCSDDSVEGGLWDAATRIFRFTQPGSAKTYDAHMHHNSMVIMLPECQRSWHHSVPTGGLEPHPVSNTVRFGIIISGRMDGQRLPRAVPQC